MNSTVEACPAPALVLVVRNSLVESEPVERYEEDEDGCVILGLISAFVIYALVALGVAGGWRLYQLLS